MNGCNLRGFLIASDHEISTIEKSSSQFKCENGGSVFYFPSHFDTFQNIKITMPTTCSVYLRCDDKEYFLGTNEYILFPNSSLPLSYPFLAYRQKNSYLFIPKTEDIFITYESSILSKEYKEELDKQTLYPYHSTYHLQNDKMYCYEKNHVHQPIQNRIEYK